MGKGSGTKGSGDIGFKKLYLMSPYLGNNKENKGN